MTERKNEEGAFRRLLELFGAAPEQRLPELEFGILQVAMMIAALDGEVSKFEVSAFKRIARKCRGWTARGAVDALSAALHSAGYLVVESRLVRERALIAAFVREACAALPKDFSERPVADIRRAFVVWVLMSWADVRFSVVERKAILELRKRLGVEESVTDGFLREVEKAVLLFADSGTADKGMSLLGAFIDLA